MSAGAGPTTLVPEGAGRGLRVAVVSSSWHEEIVTGLREGAARALRRAGVDEVVEMRVPGSFELPVAAVRVADHVDAVVALGVILRGETPHFEYVCTAATIGLTDVSTGTGIPVGFGVLTCDTEDQARDRAGLPGSREDKGQEAADAAIATVLALRTIGAGV